MPQTYSDHFVSDLIDERDKALEQNREFERIAASQDTDLKAAATTIRHLCANVEAKSRLLDTAYDGISKLKQLISNAYNVHFDYLNVSNEEWMNLFVSTLKDMRHIAEAQKNGGRS